TGLPRQREHGRPVHPDAALRCGRRYRRQILRLETLDHWRREKRQWDAGPRVPHDLPALLRVREGIAQLLDVARGRRQTPPPGGTPRTLRRCPRAASAAPAAVGSHGAEGVRGTAPRTHYRGWRTPAALLA